MTEMEQLLYLERSLQFHFKTKEILVFYSVFFLQYIFYSVFVTVYFYSVSFFLEPKHIFILFYLFIFLKLRWRLAPPLPRPLPPFPRPDMVAVAI